MCISCDMKRLNELHANASVALVESVAGCVIDLMDVVKEFREFYSACSDRGAAIDAKAQTVLDKATAVLSGVQEPTPAQTPAEGIVEAIRQAFPGAQVVVGTPEQIEAMLEKETKGEKPN